MKGLSTRQRDVLDTVLEHIRTHQRSPTLREIGAKLGIGSTNGVNDHLMRLEQKGYLRRDPMLTRSIVLLPKAQRLLTDEEPCPLCGHTSICPSCGAIPVLPVQP